jgi:uncharacterized Zn finger protein
MKINLDVDMESEDLIGELVEQLNHDDLIALIIQIDEAMQDWDFTNDLYEYFNNKHEEFLDEDIEDDGDEDIEDDEEW